MSPATAIALGRLGGLGVLDLEGLWTRYEDPEPLLAEIAALDPPSRPPAACRRSTPRTIKPDLIAARVKEIREAGVTVAGALTPQRTQQFWRTVVDAGVDLFVIRGTTVCAEHVSGRAEPLNLKQFIYELDVPVIVGGCATYTAALHLMRTGAAGVLVGFGGGAAHTTRTMLGIHVPMATAIADVAAARRDYMDESGGRYVHVIADGGMGRSGRDRQGGRLRRGRRHARRRPRPRHGAPRGTATTGAPRRTTRRCRAASACTSGPRARWRRSCSAPPAPPTAP